MRRTARWKVALIGTAVLAACLSLPTGAEGPDREEQTELRRQARQLAEQGPTNATSLILLARRAGLQVADFAFSPSAVQDQLPLVVASLETALRDGDLGPIPNGVQSYLIIRPIGGTNAERAYRDLVELGVLRRVTLIFVDADAQGTEARIYENLKQRMFRATTGPDEGIDASRVPGCPRCIFVPREDASVVSVASWKGIFIHENRHIAQIAHNSTLAQDFRDDEGRFTTYAAFCEACADDGLFTTPMYRALERMEQLRQVVGGNNEPTLVQACRGDKDAYALLEGAYDSLLDQPGAFADLFRPYW